MGEVTGSSSKSGRYPIYGPGYDIPTGRLSPLATFARTLRRRGPLETLRHVGCYLVCIPMFQRAYGRPPTFVVKGKEIPYLSGRVPTERTIEIPYAREFLRRAPPGARTLEVGNTLRRRDSRPREILDKYEHGTGIINADVLDWDPKIPYPVVISISTLEHVGFDESPREKGKFARAFHHLVADCLAPGGRMLVSLPIGYNSEVDDFIFAHPPRDARITFMRRCDALNRWQEVDRPSMEPGDRNLSYDLRYPGAQALAFVEVGPE